MLRYFKNDISSNPGEPEKIVYKPTVNKDGTITLEESGKIDFQAMIQSYEESCDINIIVNRINNGELDLLSKTEGWYGDATKMPQTYAEMLQLQIDARNSFDSLPVEVKKKFDNDFNQFLATAGTEDWYKNLGYDTQEKDVAPANKISDVAQKVSDVEKKDGDIKE